MSPAVSTEVEGWKTALSDRAVLRTLALRLVFATLCTALGVVGPDHATPLVVLLSVSGAVLVGSLVLLRVRGHV